MTKVCLDLLNLCNLRNLWIILPHLRQILRSLSRVTLIFDRGFAHALSCGNMRFFQ